MTAGHPTLAAIRRRIWRLVIVLVLALVTSVIAWLMARPSMIRVDGGRIEARLRGRGGPAVVFESGLQPGLQTFAALQRRLARTTRTLAYDRPGFGRSDAARGPRTAAAIARGLHALIAAAGVSTPVILVCYSTGCLYARVFAHDFPAETAALVLLDPMTGPFVKRMLAAPAAVRQKAKARLPAAARRETAALPATLAEVTKSWPPPKVPCMVVTALKPSGAWPFATKADLGAWLAGHEALVGRLPEATHVVLPQATHATVLESKSLVRPLDELIAALKAGGG